MSSLLTVKDIAELFRVSTRTVADKWIVRPDFPRPTFAPTRRTRLWDRAVIEKWAMPRNEK